MRIDFQNGAVSVTNSERCFNISIHATDRKVEVDARYWAARSKNDEHGERDAYIYIGINADERDYEVPADEHGSYRRKAVEQNLYLDVDDARELLKVLQRAIDCADVR